MPTATWERLPEARRAAVVGAAEAEFAARGFSGGSLNVIARNAGVAKGSLFQYFDDKGDLYSYLVDLATLRIRAHIEAGIAELDWDGALFDSLRELLGIWVTYFSEHPVDRAITAATNLEHQPEALAQVRQTVNPHYMAVLRPLLERGRDGGQLREDVDLDAFLGLLILLLPHIALAPHHVGLDPVFGLDTGDSANQEAVLDRLVEVFNSAFGVA